MNKNNRFTVKNEFLEGSGRKSNQRMKAYLVLNYLLKNSDEEHPVKIDDIVGYLQDDCGIAAERRSIYKDIKEINIANILLQNNCTFDEASDLLKDDIDLSLIRYKHPKGFFVSSQNRSILFEDARLLAECIYCAKFIPAGREQYYIDMACSSLSNYQKSRISHDVLLLDRISAINRETISNIDIIKDALSPTSPCKIKFKYLKHILKDSTPKLTERRHSSEYIVSPHAMIIDNGNYYLLGIDERYKNKHLTNFRIDRMRKVQLLNEPRIETDKTKNFELQNYTRRVFSMYGGTRERVTIRFVKSLLDVAVERFGTQDVIYSQIDPDHITATATVEISDQFFGWLCGFRHKVKIISPRGVVDDFAEYIKSISEWYQT